MSSNEWTDARNASTTRPLLRCGVVVGALYLAVGVIQGLVVAAIFPTDPVDGFPPGTPPGVPTTMSTSAVIHLASGAIGFVTLAAACFVAARAMSRRKQRSMARLSFGCGLAVLVGFFAPVAIPDAGPVGIAGIWFAVVAGWAWLAVVSTRLMRKG